jgi:hypothetical protein
MRWMVASGMVRDASKRYTVWRDKTTRSKAAWSALEVAKVLYRAERCARQRAGEIKGIIRRSNCRETAEAVGGPWISRNLCAQRRRAQK